MVKRFSTDPLPTNVESRESSSLGILACGPRGPEVMSTWLPILPQRPLKCHSRRTDGRAGATFRVPDHPIGMRRIPAPVGIQSRSGATKAGLTRLPLSPEIETDCGGGDAESSSKTGAVRVWPSRNRACASAYLRRGPLSTTAPLNPLCLRAEAADGVHANRSRHRSGGWAAAEPLRPPHPNRRGGRRCPPAGISSAVA
jgi:hypothetical protein